MSHTYRFTVTGTTITDITAQAHQEATRYYQGGDYEIDDINVDGQPYVQLDGRRTLVEADVVTRRKPLFPLGDPGHVSPLEAFADTYFARSSVARPTRPTSHRG